MEAKAEKTGDSLTFRIPKPIVNKCKLMEGSAVDIALRGDEMVITPMRKRYHLSRLLAGITLDNLHAEIGESEPVGRELL